MISYEPDDIFGPYRLLRKCSQGGFGVVWEAERTGSVPIPVAVKMPLNLGETEREALVNEAERWVEAIPHPHVQPLIDVLTDIKGTLAIVSEWATEGTLQDRLEKQKDQTGSSALPEEESVRLLRGILSGLAHLHQQNILHLDLKPSNIALCHGVPRLMDFGISRPLLEKQTHRLTVKGYGTAEYMSPEQITHKEQSRQTDVWSCGVLFYEMLTGYVPYPGQKTHVVLENQKTVGVPPPLPDTLPGYLKPLITKALQRERKDRYDDAAAMLEALEEAISDRGQQEVRALRNQLQTTAEQLSPLQEEARYLREETRNFRDKVRRSSDQLTQVRLIIQDNQKTIGSLETARTIAESERLSTAADRDDLKRRLNLAEQESKATTSELDKVRAENSQIVSQYARENSSLVQRAEAAEKLASQREADLKAAQATWGKSLPGQIQNNTGQRSRSRSWLVAGISLVCFVAGLGGRQLVNNIAAHSKYEVSNKLLKQYSSGEAEAACRKAIEFKPDYAAAHLNLGIALNRQARYSEAEAAYRKALEIKPDYAEAYFSLCSTLYHQSRYSEAEATCRKAIEFKSALVEELDSGPGSLPYHKSRYSEAYSGLGASLYDQSWYSEAESAYCKALEIKPENGEAHAALAGTLLKLNRRSDAQIEGKLARKLGYKEKNWALTKLGV